MFSESSVAERLRRHERQIGCFLNLNSPISAYLACGAGYDVILVDQEHSVSGLENAVACVNAASGHASEVWARVPGLDELYLKRILDCGVDGIICPMIETAEQAADLVRFCHYPPHGTRGLAPALGRHTGYGLFREEYMARVGQGLAVVAQIETASAVENIDAIVATEGLDVFFIGPFDLSASYGYPGRPDVPVVAAAIDRVEAAVRDAGKALASLAMPARDASVLVERRYDLIFGGADIGLLRAALDTQVRTLRAALAAKG